MMLSQLTQTSARRISINAGCITVQGNSIFQTNLSPGSAEAAGCSYRESEYAI